MSNLIRRVAIVGGTHGNEWTGVYLVKKFQKSPQLVHRPSFETVTLLANPEAIARNQRYIDCDLNRCFDPNDLNNPALTGYEDIQAKAIVSALSLDDASKVDFIIDLHSSTANMGLTLLPASQHSFNLQIMGYLCQQNPDIRVCCGVQQNRNSPMLRSIAPFGCTIEVGAIAQGVLDAHRFQQTEQLIHSILDYLDAVNHNLVQVTTSSLVIYQSIESIDYPRTPTGELDAMIHPQRQGKDYEPLEAGDPLFLTFSGETIVYQGPSIVFPIFINEAAYYEKGIAMTLTEKQQLKLASSIYSMDQEDFIS